jgi:hypothetical protein
VTPVTCWEDRVVGLFSVDAMLEISRGLTENQILIQRRASISGLKYGGSLMNRLSSVSE